MRCDQKHQLVPFVGNFACEMCNKDFRQKKGTCCLNCHCTFYCKDCLPSEPRSQEETEKLFKHSMFLKQEEHQLLCEKGHEYVFLDIHKDYNWQCSECKNPGRNVANYRCFCKVCEVSSCEVCALKRATKEKYPDYANLPDLELKAYALDVIYSDADVPDKWYPSCPLQKTQLLRRIKLDPLDFMKDYSQKYHCSHCSQEIKKGFVVFCHQHSFYCCQTCFPSHLTRDICLEIVK